MLNYITTNELNLKKNTEPSKPVSKMRGSLDPLVKKLQKDLSNSIRKGFLKSKNKKKPKN